MKVSFPYVWYISGPQGTWRITEMITESYYEPTVTAKHPLYQTISLSLVSFSVLHFAHYLNSKNSTYLVNFIPF